MAIDWTKYATKDAGYSFNRTNPIPIDKSSYFETVEAAEEYAAESVIAYAGQILSVVTEDSVEIYKVTNEKTIEKVGNGFGTLQATNYSACVALATTENIGQVLYALNAEGTPGEEDFKAAGAYIVTGAGTLQKLAQSSPSGDVEAEIAELQAEVAVIDSSIVRIDASLDAHDASIEALDASVESLDASLALTDASLAITDASLAITDASLAIIDASVQAIDASLAALDASIADTDASIVRIDASLEAIDASLAGKADAEEGKSLVDDDEIAKLATVEENAQENVIETVKVNGAALTITDKAVDVLIPEYELIKKATPDASFAAQYYLTKDGVQAGATIDIAKDQFLKEAHFYAKAEDVPATKTIPEGTAFPSLYFLFETSAGDREEWVDVSHLVDTYTADEATITISSSNVISAKLDVNGGVASYEKATALDASIEALDASVEELAGKLTDASITSWNNEVGAKELAQAAYDLDRVSALNGLTNAVVIKGETATDNNIIVAFTASGSDITAAVSGYGTAALYDASVFAGSEHTHEIADVSGLADAIVSKVDKTTTIAGISLESNISAADLRDALDVADGATKVDTSYDEDEETLTFEITRPNA